ASPDVFQTNPDVFLPTPDVFQALPLEADSFLRLRLPTDLGERFLAAIDAERRRLTAEADAIPWDEDAPAASDADPADAPRASWLAARTFSIRCRVLPSWVGLLSLLEDFADTWDDPQANPRRPGDEIYIRDGWRCTAPGCTSRRNLECHHVTYRSRGGGDESHNLICLCRFHHQRGEHGDLASCRGRAPTDVEWRLGRTSGRAGGGAASHTAGGVAGHTAGDRRDPAATAVFYRNERRIPATLLSSRA
ncbi:MAG TPA: HNH endonuclease signature motif containing protein, partial [Candidatus Polarisedimenticolia bacterium]|nr:HNH endonuclease signature motif containing protein [Candidatus Polarisedimenticolia bacterium]